MIVHVLRALFILLMAAVGWSYGGGQGSDYGKYSWLMMVITLTVGVLVICVDILSPRRKLTIFSGTFLGLIVGLFIAYALSFIVRLMVQDYIPAISPTARILLSEKVTDTDTASPLSFSPMGRPAPGGRATDTAPTTYGDLVIRFSTLMVGIISCYFSISFILQTKDDFRFVIPYVEFSKQTKGARPILLDTSVLIDGRINDIAGTGILESQLVVPRFVLQELQAVADSADKLKRNRGRRGLDMLAKLQANKRVEVVMYDSSGAEEDQPKANVDEKLMNLGKKLGARVLTNDFNLNKVAQLRGVDVININDLSNALKPVVLPGEKMRVRLVKPGEEAGQGIGYLEDGTMIVVEQGRPHLNEEVELSVTSVLQTSAGRMIFGRMGEAPPPRLAAPRHGADSTSSS